jgi:hypothetical protein
LYFDFLSFSNCLIDICVVSGRARNEQRGGEAADILLYF